MCAVSVRVHKARGEGAPSVYVERYDESSDVVRVTPVKMAAPKRITLVTSAAAPGVHRRAKEWHIEVADNAITVCLPCHCGHFSARMSARLSGTRSNRSVHALRNSMPLNGLLNSLQRHGVTLSVLAATNVDCPSEGR